MNEKLKVSFYLKKNEIKVNEPAPIMGRITIGKSMVQFSTKACIEVSLWGVQSHRAIGKSHKATQINQKLDKINVAINACYKELLKSKNEPILALQVKQAFQGIATSQEHLIAYFTKHNQNFKQRVGVDRTVGTFYCYSSTLIHLTRFVHYHYKIKDIPFVRLDHAFIENFDFFLKIHSKQAIATVLAHVIHLRTIIKLAIRDRIISRNPFSDFTPEHPKTKIRTLSQLELDQILQITLDSPNLQRTRDLFIFSCFTGIAHKDLFNLTHENIVKSDNNVYSIQTQRQKTGTPCRIPLLDIPLQIMHKYNCFSKHGRILPVSSNPLENKNLREIVAACGITKHITFHMARHTFASQICLAQGVPIETVSRMLGHRDLISTQIYAQATLEKISEDVSQLEARLQGKYKLVN